ncbi:MAG: hypothetical protein GF401_07030 [Chitinivibrionales bacterium]|nr:hypothetical protein [Chitinivibrionales bacterium]
MDIPVLNMIVRAGWIVKIILFVLAGLSIFTWAIIFNRLLYLRSVAKTNRRLLELFARSKSIRDLEKLDSKLEKSPLAIMGMSAAEEFKRILDDAHSHGNVKDWSFFLQNQFAMASESLETLVSSLASKLDHGLILLAITSSVAPFLGLLGTVWGIMNSFYEIGNQGSASLPVVAPGIAEALITTIIGLAVAIPAVFFFNYLTHRAGRLEDELDEFKELAMSKVKREVLGMLYGHRPKPETAAPGRPAR